MAEAANQDADQWRLLDEPLVMMPHKNVDSIQTGSLVTHMDPGLPETQLVFTHTDVQCRERQHLIVNDKKTEQGAQPAASINRARNGGTRHTDGHQEERQTLLNHRGSDSEEEHVTLNHRDTDSDLGTQAQTQSARHASSRDPFPARLFREDLTHLTSDSSSVVPTCRTPVDGDVHSRMQQDGSPAQQAQGLRQSHTFCCEPCTPVGSEQPATGGSEAGREAQSTPVRRLSSGDRPYWLGKVTSASLQTGDNMEKESDTHTPMLQSHVFSEGNTDIRNMTLVVPREEESYLIGRASTKGEGLVHRMTRMTEVAPTNSSIVGGEEDVWKMPLDVFTSKKQGSSAVKQFRSKRIRSYYKAQDQLITAYEDISLKVNDDLHDTEAIKKQRKVAMLFSKITLAINVMLLIAKLVVSIMSGSMSIISSLVDSVVDLLSGVVMWWATRAVRKRDPYTYPQGRTKLEPVSIIILSVVMALASLQLIRESAERIATLAGDPTVLPVMEVPTFVIAGSTVVIKFILWLVYRKVSSPTVQALAMDHRNDVMSNSVAIVCGYLGSREFQDQFHKEGFIYVDPAGAILISLYIVFNWWQTGSEQTKLLTGHTARPDFLSKLTWTAMNHDRHIRHIDTVRAFHFGNNFLVEMDIVLPEDMSLRVAHDIGESLQQRLENLPEVERAFVHLDYEYSHNPNSEHKVV